MKNNEPFQSRITAAHAVNGIPPGVRIVPYNNISQLLISKAAFHPDKVWMIFHSDPEITKQQVLAYCREQLPFAKSPKIVLFTDELPVTSTGKYQRNKVKHLFERWKDVQFRK